MAAIELAPDGNGNLQWRQGKGRWKNVVPFASDQVLGGFKLPPGDSLNADGSLTLGSGNGGSSVTLVNNLLEATAGKGLDARQGPAIKALVDNLTGVVGTKESVGVAEALINALKAGSNETIASLKASLDTLSVLVTGTTPDGDSVVDTVQEVLAAFATYPEGVNLVNTLAGKVSTADIVNALTETTAGKVLDARQGKTLNDSISALATIVNNKQTALVSGTNIKTINGVSILGSGDLVIAGGGGGTGDVTTNGSQVLSNKTISGDSNTLLNIPKSSVLGIDQVDNVPDASKPVSTAQAAAIAGGDAATLSTIRGAVPTAGDTLNKLYALIQTLNGIVGGPAADGDTIVNTVTELLAVFTQYSESVDIATLINGKVTGTIINTLTQTATGGVLDARQGKILSDSIASLTSIVNGKQAALISGMNIKTVGGVSLLGSGDIPLSTGDVTTAGVQTLSNKTLSGANNTFSNIPKASVLGIDQIDNVPDANKPVSTAQAAAIATANTNTLATVRGGVATAGDTLAKLYALIQSLNAIVGPTAADGDTLVNTVTELLAVFAQYTEAVDIATLINSKATGTVVNALTQTASGAVLDARQGKILSDAIASLTTIVNGKQATLSAGSATQYRKGDNTLGDFTAEINTLIAAAPSQRVGVDGVTLDVIIDTTVSPNVEVIAVNQTWLTTFVNNRIAAAGGSSGAVTPAPGTFEDLTFINFNSAAPITLVAGPPRYYIGTNSTDWNSGGNTGRGTKKLAAGASGMITAKYAEANNELTIFGFSTVAINDQRRDTLSNCSVIIYQNNLEKGDSGTYSNITTPIAFGTTYGIRRVITSGVAVITLETSTDGTNFTVKHTFTYASTAELYVGMALLDSHQINEPKGTGLVAA